MEETAYIIMYLGLLAFILLTAYFVGIQYIGLLDLTMETLFIHR